MKLITFAVPCYNSAAYMDKCIDSLLTGGEDVEIIIVNDGSKDETAVIADRYARQYPTICKAIHQPNGGHGEGVNQGLRNATGLYYKVVDSDDWVDTDALHEMIATMKEHQASGEIVDLYFCNYVYEHVVDNKQNVMKYSNIFEEKKICTWDEIKRFRISQYIMMHAIFYRTEALRESKMELPKHTFYVDNVFVYQPLPYMKKLCYLNLDLYRYFIGREDQSVNESVMIKRIDQQIRVTKMMTGAYSMKELNEFPKQLRHYMLNHLAMVMTISTIFLKLSKEPTNYVRADRIWEDLKAKDPALYKKLRYNVLGILSTLPGTVGRKLTIFMYRITQKIFKFN